MVRCIVTHATESTLEMIILYQFPISHYCEKVRWALEFKGLEYKTINLIPGLHIRTTKKLAAQSHVPILQHDEHIVQGSAGIITYLDQTFPQALLTPEVEELKNQALEWEQYVDAEIGVHIRRCFYHIVLQYPDICIPYLTHHGPWYGNLLLRKIYPQLNKRMRIRMDINPETEKISRHRLHVAVDKVYEHYKQQDYLVGDCFTRADLAAAALLAPLYMPRQYGLQLPEPTPSELQTLIDEFSERTEWMTEFYIRYR